MTNKQFWKDYSFVMRSKQRKIIIQLMKTPQTVTEIKKKAHLSLSETSRVLRKCTDKGLAVCINPEDHLGRIYKLTSRGEKIKEKIKEKE